MPLLLRERRAVYRGAVEPEEVVAGADVWEREERGEAVLIEFPQAAEPHLREEELVRLWEGQRFPREALKTRQGEALQVVHRGRRNLAAGPDFLDAIIADERGRLLRGDVELHVRSSAFVTHGHHLDARYDNLVLHVVFHDDAGGATALRCGRRVAVVALAPWVALRAEQLRLWLAQPSSRIEPCRSAVACGGWPGVEEILSRLGQMRFRQKKARFATALRREGANQALYEGILRTLGYSRNQDAFARLARLLPYERLRQAHDREGLLAAEALLLGTAGLLPSQRGLPDPASPYVAALERRWAKQRMESRSRASSGISAACVRRTIPPAVLPVLPVFWRVGPVSSPGWRARKRRRSLRRRASSRPGRSPRTASGGATMTSAAAAGAVQAP